MTKHAVKTVYNSNWKIVLVLTAMGLASSGVWMANLVHGVRKLVVEIVSMGHVTRPLVRVFMGALTASKDLIAVSVRFSIICNCFHIHLYQCLKKSFFKELYSRCRLWCNG